MSWTSLDSSLGGLYASLGYNHWIYSELTTIPLDKKIRHVNTLSSVAVVGNTIFYVILIFSSKGKVPKKHPLKNLLMGAHILGNGVET